AGAEGGPGDELAGSGEVADVRSHLGEEGLVRAPAEAGQGLEPLERLVKRVQTLGDFLAEPADGLVQVIDVGEMLADQEPVVLADLGHERPLQLCPLAAEAALGEPGEVRALALAGGAGAGDGAA